MRIKYLPVLVLPLILFLNLSCASCAADQEGVTGLTWLQMSMEERLDYIDTSMEILKFHGVELGKSINDYYEAVGERLQSNPELISASVTNVLASIVYEQEPGTRVAMDRIRKKPTIQTS